MMPSIALLPAIENHVAGTELTVPVPCLTQRPSYAGYESHANSYLGHQKRKPIRFQ